MHNVGEGCQDWLRLASVYRDVFCNSISHELWTVFIFFFMLQRVFRFMILVVSACCWLVDYFTIIKKENNQFSQKGERERKTYLSNSWWRSWSCQEVFVMSREEPFLVRYLTELFTNVLCTVRTFYILWLSPTSVAVFDTMRELVVSLQIFLRDCALFLKSRLAPSWEAPVTF